MIHPAPPPPLPLAPATGSLRAAGPTASATLTSSLRPRRVQLCISRRSRCLLLAVIVAVQFLCLLYLVAVGRIYAFVEEPFMAYLANLLAPASARQFSLWSVLFTVVAALHVVDLIVFAAKRDVLPKRLTRSASRFLPNPTRTQTLRSVVGSVSSLGDGVFGNHGLLGLDSDHFPVVFAVREALEVAAQCVQLYRSSELVTRPWISHVLVVLLALNCVAPLMLQRAFRGRLALERVVCLSVDVVLNIGASMVLPTIVFMPYARAFDLETFAFPMEMLYNNVAFTILVRENRALFAVSWSDGISKIIPHVATLSTLRTLRDVLLEARIVDVASSATASPAHTTQEKATSTFPLTRTMRRRRVIDALPSCLHVAFVVVSAIVVALHARAQLMPGRDTVVGCLQPVYPWFGTAYTCAIYEFNCYRRGVESPPEHVLDALDRDSLAVLLFTHCPALRVPKAIRRFPELLGIQIVNATLAEWSVDASIDANAHARMTFLALVRVNLTALPDGVLQPLPEALLDIEISVSNLTTLPDDLHERWHSLTVLYIEHAQLSAFPQTLTHLRVDDLSLAHQQITAIPELTQLRQNFFVLTLAGNPLQSLPDSIQPETTFGFVVLDETLLTSAPPWLFEQVLDYVNLFGTPLCTSAKREEIKSALTAQRLADACAVRDPTADGRFPLELVAQWTQP
ncbi:hypothetical protein PINS_up010742 [Pythium insidiosum]|nr:hypothetical protein PINS_up010742 [Pythium insidiosum]